MTPPSRECGSHAQKQTSWSSWSLQEEKPGSPLMMMSCWWRSLWRIPGTVAQTVERVVLAPPDRHPRLPQTRRGPGVRRHARQRCVPVWEGLQRPEEASEDHRGSAGGECCSRGDRNLTHEFVRDAANLQFWHCLISLKGSWSTGNIQPSISV